MAALLLIGEFGGIILTADSIAIKIAAHSSTILFHLTKGSCKKMLNSAPLEPLVPVVRHTISGVSQFKSKTHFSHSEMKPRKGPEAPRRQPNAQKPGQKI